MRQMAFKRQTSVKTSSLVRKGTKILVKKDSEIEGLYRSNPYGINNLLVDDTPVDSPGLNNED